ncbi:MAG: DUF1513 domain-containing protein [Bauldia sp.]|nr:DUF1513 domain-containing protein [Bauldia sp.]
MIDRRTFLALLGAAAASPTIAASRLLAAEPEWLYLAARKVGSAFEAAVIDPAGRALLSLPLETRGHSFAYDRARREAVAFVRELGGRALAFAPGREPVLFAPGEGRHFYGHGAFSADGNVLLATENDYETGDGVIGLYDPGAGFRRLGEFGTRGVGPHEAILMPDRKTLCVANGGIATHPDYGEVKLNLAEMSPSLAYLDIATGDLLEEVRLPADLHQLSIRHLALSADGAVWFGCQYEGPLTDDPPLVGRHVRGRDPELFAGPPELRREFQNYVGSVAVDGAGAIVATSSPRGGLVAFWDAATGRSLGADLMPSVCGVGALEEGGFLLTSADGESASLASPLAPPHATLARDRDIAWDNHLTPIPNWR